MNNVVAEAGLNRIPVGYKQTEVGVIPEDWECYSFGDLVDYKKGYAFKSNEYSKTGIRIIRVSDTNYSDIKDDSPIFISHKLASLYQAWSLKESDLIFSTVGSKPPMYDSLVGKAIYVTSKHEGSLLNQNAVRIRAKSKTEGIQLLLLNHFRTERYIDFIEVIFRGNANQASITLENLFEFKIPLPSLEKEQTAIANALSDVDMLITELEKLIAKKQAIKTATMQQLLTGRTRLPQFALREDGSKKGTKQSELGEIPEDWEVDSVGNLISITTGSRNTQDRIEEGIYPFFVRSQTVERINTFSFDGEAVLTAGDGVGTGKIFHYINGKFDFHQRVYLMYNFSELVSGYFFYIFFSNNFYDRIMSMTAKSSVDSVRREMIADMKMILPIKEEQTAIATILSDMDEEIQALEQRLSKTRQIKQGMMQELLTGRTRLV